jgi:dethiobiotin synthase
VSLLLVAGTSTDVGKTVATAALATVAARAGVVGVCKPAQTGLAPGEPGDLTEITRLSGVDRTLELARYPEPLAPDTAARRSGLPLLTLDATVDALAVFAAGNDRTLVEGAGGLLVRIGADFTLLELAQRLAAPVVLVTAAGLGTLNHTELTTRALAAAGVPCAGLIIGSRAAAPDLAARCNESDLPRLTGIPLVAAIPAGAGAWPRAEFAAAAPTWFTPAFTETLGRSAPARGRAPIAG